METRKRLLRDVTIKRDTFRGKDIKVFSSKKVWKWKKKIDVVAFLQKMLFLCRGLKHAGHILPARCICSPVVLRQGSQTLGSRSCQIHFCGPQLSKKLRKSFTWSNLAYLECSISNLPLAEHFFSGVWPSDQFEFKTPVLVLLTQSFHVATFNNFFLNIE